MTSLLLVPMSAGLITAAMGWFLRSRQVDNEHWLWRKQRLRRARILLRSGALVTAASGVALVAGLTGLAV